MPSSLLYRFAARKPKPAQAAPELELSAPLLSWQLTAGAGTSQQAVTVRDRWGGRLPQPVAGTVQYGGTGSGWATVLAWSQHANGRDWVLTVTADETGQSVGQHAASVSIWAFGATAGPVTLQLALERVSSQNAVIQPAWTTNDTLQGTEGSSTVTPRTTVSTRIRNAGLPGSSFANLAVGAAAAPWCTVATREDANNVWWLDFVIVGAQVALLAPGSYVNYADLSDANASQSVRMYQPIDISTPTPSGILIAAPGSLVFVFQPGDTAPQTLRARLSANAVALAGPQITESLAWLTTTVTADTVQVGTYFLDVTVDPTALSNGVTNGQLTATDPACSNTLLVSVTADKQTAAGQYTSPPWALPSGATHSTSTDAITYDPFAGADPLPEDF